MIYYSKSKWIIEPISSLLVNNIASYTLFPYCLFFILNRSCTVCIGGYKSIRPVSSYRSPLIWLKGLEWWNRWANACANAARGKSDSRDSWKSEKCVNYRKTLIPRIVDLKVWFRVLSEEIIRLGTVRRWKLLCIQVLIPGHWLQSARFCLKCIWIWVKGNSLWIFWLIRYVFLC